MPLPRTRRAGFTLLELLVVVALITLLLGITLAAVVRFRAASEKNTTEAMLGKLASAMDQQMKAVVDQALEEIAQNQPQYAAAQPALNQIAQSDPRRLKALYIKMRIKQEFPQSFAEVNNGFQVGTNANPGPGITPVFFKDNYRRAVSGGAGTPAQENAACLFLALSVTRRGMAGVKNEDLGALGTTEIMLGGKSFKVFTDVWGTPITCCRWPVANAELLQTVANVDSQDPESMLYQSNPANATWISNWLNNNPNWGQAYTFNMLQSQLHLLTNPVHNLPPTIISAGIDRTLNSQLNDLADVNSDDILSFRLRKSGQKGD